MTLILANPVRQKGESGKKVNASDGVANPVRQKGESGKKVNPAKR